MLRFRTDHFPPQLWLLFWGTLTGSIGQSIVWPFLTIYIRERLDVPLTTVTLLFTLQSVAGFSAMAMVGPLMDRLGRRTPMIAGLVLSGLSLVFMSQATALWHWAVLLPMYGMVNTVFRIGSYAMVADLIEVERRAGVYALLRTGDNLGIVFGPALGGFLAQVAYVLSYLTAAATQFILAIFVYRIIRETLARNTGPDDAVPAGLGYRTMLRDRAFANVWGLYILAQIASSMVFVLLGLYVKENFGISEARYGLIIGTNAAIVVAFQYGVTRHTARYSPLRTMAGGALLYVFGLGIFAISRSFAGFLSGMVVFTGGEMLLVPTATAYVANLAPLAMRARYIGVFSLSFRIGSGVGPVIGGLLSDQIAPAATWYGAMVVCSIAAAGFTRLVRRQTTARAIAEESSGKASRGGLSCNSHFAPSPGLSPFKMQWRKRSVSSPSPHLGRDLGRG